VSERRKTDKFFLAETHFSPALINRCLARPPLAV